MTAVRIPAETVGEQVNNALQHLASARGFGCPDGTRELEGFLAAAEQRLRWAIEKDREIRRSGTPELERALADLIEIAQERGRWTSFLRVAGDEAGAARLAGDLAEAAARIRQLVYHAHGGPPAAGTI